MTFLQVKQRLGEAVLFTVEDLCVVVGTDRNSVARQVLRWKAEGLVVPLRRGLYGFPDRLQQLSVRDLWIANRMYRPSYVSCERALHYHGMIAETVFAVTSVTTRNTAKLENSTGAFFYHAVKPELFWGYQCVELTDRPIYAVKQGPLFLARPEKALLDYLWLRPGVTWCAERMEAELRLRFSERFNVRRFMSYAKKFHSPRMLQAASVALEVMQEERASWEQVPEDFEEPLTITQGPDHVEGLRD